MSPRVHDIIVLLHRICGSPNVRLFKDWMYFYIQIVLEGLQFLDWAELIASSLRNQLKVGFEPKERFSYVLIFDIC